MGHADINMDFTSNKYHPSVQIAVVDPSPVSLFVHAGYEHRACQTVSRDGVVILKLNASIKFILSEEQYPCSEYLHNDTICMFQSTHTLVIV